METIPRSTAEQQGGVYLIRMEGTNYFKVGISSTNIGQRITTLQTSSPFRLELIAWRKQDNPLEVEQSIHRALRAYHVRGEWFGCDETTIYCIFDDINVMATIDALLPCDLQLIMEPSATDITSDVTNADVDVDVDDIMPRVKELVSNNPTISQRALELEVFGYTGGQAHSAIRKAVQEIRQDTQGVTMR